MKKFFKVALALCVIATITALSTAATAKASPISHTISFAKDNTPGGGSGSSDSDNSDSGNSDSWMTNCVGGNGSDSSIHFVDEARSSNPRP